MMALGTLVTGREVKVGDRVNFGYPQIGYTEVVRINDGATRPHVGRVRFALCDDGTRRALFAGQRSYSVAAK